MSKKIIVKMRNIKKILGNEMLHLAIMLSLMRADPEFLLFPGGRGGGMDNYDAGDAFPGKELMGEAFTFNGLGFVILCKYGGNQVLIMIYRVNLVVVDLS